LDRSDCGRNVVDDVDCHRFYTPTIQQLNRRFFLHKMKPNLDNCVEILHNDYTFGYPKFRNIIAQIDYISLAPSSDNLYFSGFCVYLG